MSASRPAATIRIEPGEVPTVIVEGELDVSNATQLGDTVGTALYGVPLVHVDLAAVTFADSTALGALVGAHERAVAAGKLICVSSVSDVVDALFHLAGLSDVLRC